MIGAFLSNTPAAVLKGSGVAGDSGTVSGDGSSGQEPEAAGSSLASARAEAGRTSSGPVLTPQAVLALQETEASGKAPERNRGGTAAASTAAEDAAGEEEAPASRAGPATGGKAGEGTSVAGAEGEGGGEDADGDGLDEAEEKQVEKLKQRDREVRAHEQAHARTGGAYAGAPSYTFQQGPDGKRYAIGGEVSIDTSKERTPEATVRKMQIVIRAATAPADPSSQDLKVAQQARSQLAEAQADVRQARTEEQSGSSDENDASAGTQGDPPGSGEAGPESGVNGTPSEEGQTPDAGKSREQGSEAISAYRSAQQRADEAQATFNAVIS